MTKNAGEEFKIFLSNFKKKFPNVKKEEMIDCIEKYEEGFDLEILDLTPQEQEEVNNFVKVVEESLKKDLGNEQ